MLKKKISREIWRTYAVHTLHKVNFHHSSIKQSPGAHCSQRLHISIVSIATSWAQLSWSICYSAHWFNCCGSHSIVAHYHFPTGHSSMLLCTHWIFPKHLTECITVLCWINFPRLICRIISTTGLKTFSETTRTALVLVTKFQNSERFWRVSYKVPVWVQLRTLLQHLTCIQLHLEVCWWYVSSHTSW